MCVVKISSVRDISKSSIEDVWKNSNRRLLKLTLTDGHSEISAIEFTHIPSIPSDVVPGTKVHPLPMLLLVAMLMLLPQPPVGIFSPHNLVLSDEMNESSLSDQCLTQIWG